MNLFMIIGVVAVITESVYCATFDPSSSENEIFSPEEKLKLISRDEWFAQAPAYPLTDVEQPVKRIIIIHTATDSCTSQSECSLKARIIQTFHMESRSFDDIGYNFLVGGDGSVYEGRGWDKQGAHSKGYNKDSIGIAFIGTFNTVTPPKKQLEAAQKLIEEGVRLGKVAKDYKLYGHRQFFSTTSPGDALYSIITRWNNWSQEL